MDTKQTEMKFIGFYNYTVILTYLGAAAALCGIFFSASGNPFLGVICLLFAGLTDMFDGKVASTMERTTMQKNFGIEIDSLCDLLSFCILPSAIGYGIGLNGPIFYISAIILFLCGVIRLAYFNVDEYERQKTENTRRKSYIGLPVTSTALVFPLIFGIGNIIGKDIMSIIYQAFLFIVPFHFVKYFEIKKPAGKKAAILLIIGIAIALGVIISTILFS